MKRWVTLSAALTLFAGVIATAVFVRAQPHEDGKDKPAADALKVAASRITNVTVYQGTALVTREVDVPEGAGLVELVVTPLPPTTVNSSLYSEGSDGMRILTTRFRMRPILEDTREEVRKLEARLKTQRESVQKLQADLQTLEANLKMLDKLENFTSASTQHMTEKGTLNAETIISLTKHVMDTRAEKIKDQVALKQQLANLQEEMQFAERQLRDLSAGSSKTERDAVIIVDKKEKAAGKIRLNYLVDTPSWRPQYKFRAGKDEKEPVQLEYLAAVSQQSGEDWNNVSLTFSTAQPLLNAAPPDLKALEVALLPKGNGQPMGIPQPGMAKDNFAKAQQLRGQAGLEYNNNKDPQSGGKLINDAAALEQTNEFLWTSKEDIQQAQKKSGGIAREGQSVTYHLAARFTVPSRNDEQVLEVTRLNMEPEYFYKAVPVLTSHVYRLANLNNKSDYVLLPGEATMYLGTDFVGRMDLPLVAVGEQFTAGFGVDPQLQVARQMVDKSRAMQGGNEVLRYEYRILVSSYKAEPVKVEVWDRLPHAEAEKVAVSVVKAEPEMSPDPIYAREQKPNNLLRWDLKVEPAMNGEKAKTIKYEFKLELDKQMTIGSFQSR
jgi:uncharacterized protein (TIGR02231 family)